MTDRLADLQRGERYSSASVEADIEVGLDEESERLLQGFNRESAAIEKVLTWADGVISSVSASLSAGSASSRTEELEKVETKLHAVRRRLKKMADDNRSFAAENSSRPATVRTRLVRYTKLGKDFIAVTGRLAETKESHKASLTAGLKQAVLDVNPNASERSVDAALRNGDQLESVLDDRGSSEMRHQIADIHARNADIQQLVKSIANLNQMFQDMSILVETQQTLINDVEYNVQGVKEDVKKAGDELVQARRHQKSKNKKKMCIIVLVLVIIAIIVISITVPILKLAKRSRVLQTSAPAPVGNGPVNLNVRQAPVSTSSETVLRR